MFDTLIDPADNGGVGIAFTDRQGGVSTAAQASLNLGRSDVDQCSYLRTNMARVRAATGIGPVAALHQVHGIAVHNADEDGRDWRTTLGLGTGYLALLHCLSRTPLSPLGAVWRFWCGWPIACQCCWPTRGPASWRLPMLGAGVCSRACWSRLSRPCAARVPVTCRRGWVRISAGGVTRCPCRWPPTLRRCCPPRAPQPVGGHLRSTSAPARRPSWSI